MARRRDARNCRSSAVVAAASALAAPLLLPALPSYGLSCSRYIAYCLAAPCQPRGKGRRILTHMGAVPQKAVPISQPPAAGGSLSSKVTGALTLRTRNYKLPDPYKIDRRVFPAVLKTTLWSAAVAAVASNISRSKTTLSFVVHPLMVGVLGLLLAFRTNQAFERHWMCCKIWAQLHKSLQNMARLATHLSQNDFEKYGAILRHLIAFPIALKQSLRKQRYQPEYHSILPMTEIEPIMRAENPHLVILNSLSMLLQPIRASDDGRGHQIALWNSMERCLGELQAVSCDLDLVKKVPIPRSYSLFTSRFVLIWIASLPFVLVDYIPAVVVPVAMACIAWALYSMEKLAQLMEEPFKKPETVPLDDFTRRIAAELKQGIFLQSDLERRVSERTWVVKPEDLEINVVLEVPESTDKTPVTDV